LAKPNVDPDFASKYISMNQLSIPGVYGLVFERIYHKTYIAKFTHLFWRAKLGANVQGFLTQGVLREFRDGLMEYCKLVGVLCISHAGIAC